MTHRRFKAGPMLRMTAAVCMLAMAPVAVAQHALAAPEPLQQQLRQGPVTANGDATEGWAIVRYSVLADGTTGDIRVVGLAPPAIDPASVIETVSQWQFRPATRDGESVAWHNNEAVIGFRDETGSVSSSPLFETEYDAITAMMEMDPPDGVPEEEDLPEFDAALDANRELITMHARRFGDVGLALAQSMMINVGLDDRQTAYELARLVTHPQVGALAGEDLLVALQIRLRLEVQLGRTSDALDTYDRIAAGYAPDDRDPFAGLADSLRERWEDDDILPVLGHVGLEPWRIDAERRIFSLGDIDGAIESIDAECDTIRLTLDYQPDIDWALPDSFGDCSLFVNGAPGTNFVFYEMLPADE